MSYSESTVSRGKKNNDLSTSIYCPVFILRMLLPITKNGLNNKRHVFWHNKRSRDKWFWVNKFSNSMTLEFQIYFSAILSGFPHGFKMAAITQKIMTFLNFTWKVLKSNFSSRLFLIRDKNQKPPIYFLYSLAKIFFHTVMPKTITSKENWLSLTGLDQSIFASWS